MNTSTIWTTIVGTGSYIPERRIANSDFLSNEFYSSEGDKLERSNQDTIEKFEAITDIKERRYVTDDLQTSDVAFFAAEDALASSGIDRESLDYVIVANNFGDVAANNCRSDFVPTLAARVKHRLEIENPATVAYDLPFGCAGWVLGLIQADYYVRSGDAKRALVIGAETLSRVTDPHDRDTMIYADGAGACIVEGVTSDSPVGILAHCTRSDTIKHIHLLKMAPSYNPDFSGGDLFLKMQGHKLYEYALRFVPRVVKECLSKAGVSLDDVSKVLIHQANAKMDEAILERVFKICGADSVPPQVMPMIISWLGNSSVATVPTLLDLILKGKVEGHRLESGETIVLVSVGAGMNISSVVYTLP